MAQLWVNWAELGHTSSKPGSDLRNDLDEAMTSWAAHKYKLHHLAPQIVMEDSAKATLLSFSGHDVFNFVGS